MKVTIRNKVITIRVTPEEHKLLKEAAKAAGMSLNKWCREVLLAAAKRELKKGV